MAIYYEHCRKTGDLIPHEYQEGNAALGIRSTLPSGRYIDRFGLKIRIGESIGAINYAGSDAIDPILNHANGKMYDSRSQYYRDLKASGHVIVDSPPSEKTELKGNFDARADVAKALNQLGY